MSDPRPAEPGQRSNAFFALAHVSDRLIGAIVALAAAIPTLIAAAMRPELLLDDIEFAATARFDGWSGFLYEMSYRPGQGLIHALQFNLFGEHPSVHLVVLAVGNALAAWLFWRLLALAVPRGIAVATIATFVVLPNRGSLHFWTSTLPNHVAMCLLLLAAILAAKRILSVRNLGGQPVSGDAAPSSSSFWQEHPGSLWCAVTLLSLLSIITYEATISLAPFITLALAATSPTRRGRLFLPAGVFTLFGVAALTLKARSPRSEASTLFARPLDAIPKHLGAIAPGAFATLGAALVIGCLLWGIGELARRRRLASSEARFAAVGTVIALAGLAPFAAAGFNIQSHGVLDRAHYFPTLGTALVIGAAIHGLRRSSDSIMVRGVVVAAVALCVVGQVEDLGSYTRSSADQREAASALASLSHDDANDGVRIANPPTGGGVGWGFYGHQVRDLYRLVHDDPTEPAWLAFGSRSATDDPPANLAYFEIENGTLVEAGVGEDLD